MGYVYLREREVYFVNIQLCFIERRGGPCSLLRRKSLSLGVPGLIQSYVMNGPVKDLLSVVLNLAKKTW